MTENDKTVIRPDGGSINDGVALLPKTDKRPLGIVGLDGITDEIKALSERLTEIGMEHVVLTVEEAEKEGITRDALIKVQQEQKNNLEGHQAREQMKSLQFTARDEYADDFIDSTKHVRPKKGGGSKQQQIFKRKKKGKKTHRKTKKGKKK